MHHFFLDAYGSYRSRLDDIALVHEFLEEVPLKLGLRTIMPPFVLPYYNGIVPEDRGISAFVFLEGGHFTIHTFSYRGVFFCDLLNLQAVDAERLRAQIEEAFPSDRTFQNFVERKKGFRVDRPDPDRKKDFGPHLMLDFEEYRGPATLDDLFGFFDTLPYDIGMTPIMRPYGLRNRTPRGEVVSVLTMIAESHISLHCFPGEGKAYFDIFSCSFFDDKRVSRELKKRLPGRLAAEALISRGGKYKDFREGRREKVRYSRQWLKHAHGRRQRS
jgi:S-adenosylmethionine/arginine decarboxylase-like enzyme